MRCALGSSFMLKNPIATINTSVKNSLESSRRLIRVIPSKTVVSQFTRARAGTIIKKKKKKKKKKKNCTSWNRTVKK
nr:hypothetical protein [Cressdnaviricota sp.]